MQKSEKGFEKGNFVRSVWTIVDPDDSVYIHRCSFCGYRRKELREHWFFTGLYCRGCIQEVLWNDVRTFKEMES